MELIVLLVYMVAFPLAGAFIAKEKGREASEGVILGLLIGPIGLVIEACLPTKANVDQKDPH